MAVWEENRAGMTSDHKRVDILVAGAINTDLVATVSRAPEAGETVTGSGFAMFGGGKGANQAVASARSGVNVVMLGAIGDDDFGLARHHDLLNDGIDTGWIETIREAASGVALITVEAHGENRIAYIPGATGTITADRAVACLEAVQPRVLLVPNELNHMALLAMCKVARSIGVVVILNAAPDPGTVSEVLPHVDILIANEDEAIVLAKSGIDELSVEQIAELIRGMGPRKVVITVGGDGMIGLDIDGAFVVTAPAVNVVDTTGAGDTFCGALAAALVNGASFRDACRYAVAAGALSVTSAGAQSSIPSRGEIESFLGR
jgi:ribokinase